MRFVLRLLGFLFAAGTIVFIVGVAGAAAMLWHYSKDLPDYSQLQDYEPPVMTRVHAADGSLLAEYANQRRLYLPIQAIPKLVTNAFVAAEDKNFYQHPGIDFTGMARAGLFYVENYGTGRRPQGASTITQQVAKNFLLTNEVSYDRKMKQALMALRNEKTYSKEKILELYLNEIYLGFGAYGVAAASLLYFDKSVHELTIAQAAYLAALPKGPNNYNPFRRKDEAIARRNYVIDRMVEDGYITTADAETAKKQPLDITVRPTGAHVFAAYQNFAVFREAELASGQHFADRSLRGAKRMVEADERCGLGHPVALHDRVADTAEKFFRFGRERRSTRNERPKFPAKAPVNATEFPGAAKKFLAVRGFERACKPFLLTG